MNKDKYQHHIVKKYKLENKVQLQVYARLDAMISFYNRIKSKNTIFKGALNLYIKKNYVREEITKDLDIALFELSPVVFASTLETEDILTHDIYTYKYKKTEKLSISTSGYGGIRLFFDAVLPMKSSFHVDIAVEELPISTWAHADDQGSLSYSIERTLADKFVTIFQRKETNSREKDFIDISVFLKETNKSELSSLINDLILARGISTEEVVQVKNEWRDYLFMDNPKYNEPIAEMMEMIK